MKKKILETIRSFVESFLLAAIIAVLLLNFVLMSVRVSGSSMYPNLVDGDRGISLIVTKKLGIKRFDICIIDTDLNDSLLVKRVIGLPGETIEYIDNKLYVNGEYIKEDFLRDSVNTNDFKVTLKENEYYCLGDNRQVSNDSRHYGPFLEEEIAATNLFVYYPFNHLGIK